MAIKVTLISLGCAKNLVDSETMLGLLSENGIILSEDLSDTDVAVVNTCGFIESAKTEAIDRILDLVDLKNRGIIKGIVVSGCLSQRYRDTIAEEFPEVDAFLGTTSEKDIAEAVLNAYSNRFFQSYDIPGDRPLFGKRILSTGCFAYLKIAEGCNNRCSYCAIPIIRGSFRSVPMDDLIVQAGELAKAGVKELCVVAQDPTAYGTDIYGRKMLPDLLERLAKIQGIEWIRVLYLYPDKIDDSLLKIIKSNDKILNYIDMPVQHCCKDILKAMNRPGDMNSLEEIIRKIRSELPGAVIRTTLITGFPGETEKHFEELCSFVKRMRFDKLGVFTYSPEEDTPAAGFDGQIDDDVKQRRFEILMEIQNSVSSEIMKSFVGKTLTVITEEYDEESESYIGRSYADAPEVDGKVFFSSTENLNPGDFVKVSITGCTDYDLKGEAE